MKKTGLPFLEKKTGNIVLHSVAMFRSQSGMTFMMYCQMKNSLKKKPNGGLGSRLRLGFMQNLASSGMPPFCSNEVCRVS